jgi:hypothetical protein
MNTFIKICLLDTGGRISEIQKRLNSTGGYDFYKPLSGAVRAHCDRDYDEVEDILNAPSNDVERNHNRFAFNKFSDKFGSKTSLEKITKSKKIMFDASDISITVGPLFEIEKSGDRQIYCLWPTQKPPLSQRYGAVACHLMRRAFANETLGNGSFYFADLVSNKVYSEKQISNNTALILKADAQSIGNLIKEL